MSEFAPLPTANQALARLRRWRSHLNQPGVPRGPDARFTVKQGLAALASIGRNFKWAVSIFHLAGLTMGGVAGYTTGPMACLILGLPGTRLLEKAGRIGGMTHAGKVQIGALARVVLLNAIALKNLATVIKTLPADHNLAVAAAIVSATEQTAKLLDQAGDQVRRLTRQAQGMAKLQHQMENAIDVLRSPTSTLELTASVLRQVRVFADNVARVNVLRQRWAAAHADAYGRATRDTIAATLSPQSDRVLEIDNAPFIVDARNQMMDFVSDCPELAAGEVGADGWPRTQAPTVGFPLLECARASMPSEIAVQLGV